MANFVSADWPASAVRMRRLEDLKPSPRNSRRHSEDEILSLSRSMEEYGWTMPILVDEDDEDDEIIVGHRRLAAAKRIGWTEGPVITAVGWSEDQKRAYRIADNRHAENASWDEAILAEELSDLLDAGADATLTGFTDAEIAKILDPGSDGEVVEVHTGPVSDRFWISIRGPLGAQAKVLDHLKAACDGIFDVEIDVGALALGK